MNINNKFLQSKIKKYLLILVTSLFIIFFHNQIFAQQNDVASKLLEDLGFSETEINSVLRDLTAKENKNEIKKEEQSIESENSRELYLENLFKDFQRNFEEEFVNVPPTPLERYYSERSGEKLFLQGYNFEFLGS